MYARLLLICISSSLLLLSACSNTPSGTQTRDGVILDRGRGSNSVSELLRRADRAEGEIAANFELQAAMLLYEQGRLAEADSLLSSIDLNGLPIELDADIQLFRAELAMEQDQNRIVLDLLHSSNFPSLTILDNNYQQRYHRLRAQAYYGIDAMLSSALERILLDRLLSEQAKLNNHELIWEALGTIPLSQLQALSSTAINYEVHGWYELALIDRQFGNDLDRQLVALRRWREGWARHPAATLLPTALDQVEIMARERPTQIALLLPLDSTAGLIVRDAFMSAYFNLLELGGQVPELILYNTSSTNDILSLHQQAVDEGAQLIIGPLLKEHVAVLQQSPNILVPTLALNNIEGSNPASPLLYQFSLSPEDEARQLAHKVWRDGHRRVAILHPLGEPRKRDSFISEWQSLGGIIVTVENFRDDYTDTIARMLELDHSNERHQRINQVLRKQTEFQPRKRTDIDSLLLIAQPTDARQIVPSLSYLYAGDIPVYASQDVYSGIPSPIEDRDLNAVTFGESPWLLGQDDSSVSQTKALFPLPDARTLRLQAFGIDAFRLYPRLGILKSSPSAVLPGASGMLRLGQDQNIVRQLTWTSIRNGLAVAQE